DLAVGGGRAILGTGTLGVSEIVIGTYQFTQDGDGERLRTHMAGVAVGNLLQANALRGTAVGAAPLRQAPKLLVQQASTAVQQIGAAVRSAGGKLAAEPRA